MFKIRVRFVDSSSLDYISKDEEELNKIRFSIENNTPLAITEGSRTILVNPQNIIFLDVSEAKGKEPIQNGTGFLIECDKCGEVSTIKAKHTGQTTCYKCKGEEK
ncbi:hypothetical protein [Streptococcus dysgalactiae]|uniref:Phage protein n=1 Tax=Streptococcus dysgalactiae subsp. dysgalactiae TaxID=99822 RepID=A0A9X7SEL5_STRDY|nr:hypothetical protein [Streptococcus dysgalactiae]QGH01206.1 hypothetical protein EA457_00800 [Streptococcus dysgalactiae subsp. dysgalactiae]